MNFSKNEFWKQVEKSTRLKELSKRLEQYPSWGIGSEGGGRVLICENCGYIKYIENKEQQFCSRKCHHDYYTKDTKPSPLPKEFSHAKQRRNLHRSCGYCGKTFLVKTSRLKAGEHIYCSSKCANHSKGLKAIWFYCNECHMPFRAVSDNTCRYCSHECSIKHHMVNEDGSYNEAQPKFQDLSDLLDHKLNLILKSIQSDNPDLLINPQLRMDVLTKKKIKVDAYYLTAKQRDQLELLHELLARNPVID